MVEPSIKIVGDKKLALKLSRKAKRLKPDVMVKCINESLIDMLGQVRKNISNVILNVGFERGGQLRRSFHIKNASVATLSGKIGSPMIYARIHEFGGIIKPVRAKWLRFKTRDGSWHMVKQVKIPARKYFSKSIKQAMPKVRKRWDKQIRKFVK